MPPDPFPWDSNRRGVDYRRQQYDRSGSDPRGFGFGSSGDRRWRENYHRSDDYYRHHSPMPHERPPSSYYHQPHRRLYSDFRNSRPLPHAYPCYDKQGSWRAYPDDAGDGFPPFVSRYGTRNLEDGYSRPFGSRNGDGRYLRNNKDNRGSFTHKEWRTSSWEPTASSSGSGRVDSDTNGPRSTENTKTLFVDSKSSNANGPQSDALNQSSQSESVVTELLDKNSSGAAIDGQDTSTQRSEKKDSLGSMDWKPMKWSRSGALASRGSGLSQECSDMIQSPHAVDAAACAASIASARSDDDDSRKKPRLGWGEGLAKYEKKKVEGNGDGSISSGLDVSVSGSDVLHSPYVNIPEKSFRVSNLSDCATPTTPSSVACSSSPGVVSKESAKKANTDQDMSTCSPGLVSQTFFDGPVFNLENLELASIASFSTLIDDLLVQCDSQSDAGAGYVGSSLINKLMVWKADILKGLEITESEIDSLETQLKSLGSETCDRPLRPECPLKACEESGSGSHFATKPASLQIVPSQDTVDENEASLHYEFGGSKNEDFDSPSSATSKFVERLPSGENIFLFDATECVQDHVHDNPKSLNLAEKRLKIGPNDVEAGSVGNSAPHAIDECEKLCMGDFVHFDDMELIYDAVFSSNKVSAGKAEEELNKLLPDKQCPLDATALLLSLPRVSSMVKDKFLRKKRFLQFKEKVLAIKFRVHQHFWKQGRVVSVKKHSAKAHKKYDLSISGFKKNRSSGRFRILSPAESPQIVPAYEAVEYVKNFLLHPVRPCRNTLKMPALMLDKETKMSRFISTNRLVEDPLAVERERSVINTWTSEEKEIFAAKLAAVGKNFRVIASFLDHKTTADCVEFYYKTQKSDCFGKSRKKPGSTKQRKSQSTTYLVASVNKWNRESNAASLDILGSASAIAACSNDGPDIPNYALRCISPADNSYKALRNDGFSKRSRSPDLYSYDRETVAADVLARIGGSFLSETVSYCNTNSLDPVDRSLVCRSHRFRASMRHSLTTEVDDDDEFSDESSGEVNSSDWTEEEKFMFVHALSSYGKDFAMISQYVRSRSKDQCKLFFSKGEKCLGFGLIQPRSQHCADVNGSGVGDSDDAIDMETRSTILNDCLESKLDESDPLDSMAAAILVDCSNVGIKEQNVEREVESSEPKVEECNSIPPSYMGEAKYMASADVSDGFGKKTVNDKKAEYREAADSEEVNGSNCGINEVNSSGPSSEQNDHLESMNSLTLFTVPVKFQKHFNPQKIVDRRSYSQQQLPSCSYSDSVNSSHMLKGYPVSVQVVKEDLNRDVSSKSAASLENIPKRDGKFHNDHHSEFLLQKCSSSTQQSKSEKTTTIPSPELSRPYAHEQPSGNGDVKLFGKILVSSSKQENGSARPKTGGQSLNLNQKVVSSDSSSKSKLSSKSIPCQSSGFWDMKRMQTDYPPFPDSALLLAQYPSAFGNYNPVPTMKLVHPPENYGRSILNNGISVLPGKEVINGSNGCYLPSMYGGELHQHPFVVDLQHQQQQQRKNGFDLLSEMTQLSISGGGVSDPVAAIKMHYVNQMEGIVVREDDNTWRINGDVGR